MAISIDHTTSPLTIYIPKADTTLVSAASTPFPELRSLDMEVFHNALRTLQTVDEDSIKPVTHDHTPEATLAGIIYPRRVQISDEYVVEFEEGGSHWRVRLEGGDNNIEDRQVSNNVSVSTFNSKGNTVTAIGSGVTEQDKDDIRDRIMDHIIADTTIFAEVIAEVFARLDLDSTKPNTYQNDGSEIAGDDFTLTKTDNGDGTSTVQRS